MPDVHPIQVVSSNNLFGSVVGTVRDKSDTRHLQHELTALPVNCNAS
jgi:hypothetical protein